MTSGRKEVFDVVKAYALGQFGLMCANMLKDNMPITDYVRGKRELQQLLRKVRQELGISLSMGMRGIRKLRIRNFINSVMLAQEDFGIQTETAIEGGVNL